MAEIFRLCPDDWDQFRGVRIAGLTEAAYAFGSTVERELAFGESEWRTRLSSPSFVARAGEELVGMVGAYRPPDDTDPHLVSMWVAPDHRGSGVAEQLVAAVIDWAEKEGAKRVVLWVLEDNARARRFYSRVGFVDTGKRKPLPRDESCEEVEMALALR